MIVYIKPHSSIPFEFEHMKPIPIEFDSVDDRISFDTFKCTSRYDSDGIQSIWVTAFMVGRWNEVEISFTEDMKLVTHGGFYLKAINSELRTLMGTIKFYDMSSAVEMVHYNKYKIGTVDKGTRSLRAIYELKVEKIITNGPATIVFWNDRTKTIVKRDNYDEDDLYDAVANALAKKIFGSTSKFHKTIDKKSGTNEKGWIK